MSVVEIDGKAERDPSAEKAADAAPAEAAWHRRRTGRSLRLAGIGLALLAGLLLLGHWLANRWAHVYIADSRVAAEVVTVSSEVAGRVAAVPVIAGDRVREGDLLVGIESRRTRLALQEIDARIARIEAEQDELRARQAMVRAVVDRKLAAARAGLAAAEADHRASEAELASVRSEHGRVNALHAQGIVSSRRFEESRARFVRARQDALRSAAGIETARANLAVIEAERAEITVLDRQIATLEAEKAAEIARRGQRLVDLDEREVRAAFDGVIDETFVDAGEYVSAGTRLLMYHDPAKVWVDANVKETEFGRLKIGAPATITVDAYPDREFRGEVVRLGHAATSQFALLPSPNPSGNFTKVTQRLPVRIRVEQEGMLLRPGMMVEVAIDVVD